MLFILRIFSWVAVAFAATVQKCMAFLEKKCEAVLPPFRIQLDPSSDNAWTSSKEVQRLAQELAAAGFTPSGTYDIRGIAGARMMIFCHDGSDVMGSVVGLGKKVWLEVKTVLVSGRSISISTGESFDLPQRPGSEYLPPAAPNVSALHEQVLRARGSALALPLSSDMLAPLAEQEYAKHANWIAERGGYTREEICRVIVRGKKPDHPDVYFVREQLVRKALANWWILQSDVPRIEPEDFHNCVTIIHDDLLRDTPDYVFSDASGDWDAEIKKVPGHLPPREAFALLNQMRGEPLVRVVEKTTPLEADFYVHRSLLESEEQGEGPDEEQALRA